MQRVKKFFKRGNGELLGFAVCLYPFTLLLLLIISITQIAISKETLSYAAYTSARSAVVAENFDQAYTNANAIVQEIKNQNGYQSASVEILVNGVSARPGDSVAWSKGVFITVKVTFYVDTLLEPLSDNRSSSIVMMVERPASTGGDYIS